MQDVLIIGAGFGGLGAALTLAESGARVTLCEALNYPGGCASTFTRGGHTFESGATLFSGFSPQQLFADWIARHRLDVKTVALDPIVELRAPRLRLPISSDRERLIDELCRLPGAPAERIRGFFELQRRVSATLWPLLDEPSLLPPFTLSSLARHASRLPRYAPLLTLAGRPLLSVLRAHGVAQFAPLRLFIDAVCQITVQASAEEAEAPLALAALDYFFRGTRHVQGGIGVLATALAGAVEELGGEVRFADAVKSVEPLGTTRRAGFRVVTRTGAIEARTVVANLLPQDLRALVRVPIASARLDRLTRGLEGGWGAVMLFRALLDAQALPRTAAHLELIADPDAPLIEGNHLFCSLSAADEKEGPQGARSLTVSTHLALQKLRAQDDAGQAALVAQVQARMRATLSALAPEFAATSMELTGSPRTFARFTRRSGGAVGGVPRIAGLHHYRDLAPLEAQPGLFLVGDSVFPGQSILAAATGGERAAAKILARLAPSTSN